MGRDAAGVKGIALSSEDEVVGLIRVEPDADLLTVTINGYGKRTDLDEYLVQSEDGTSHAQNRGGKGRRDIQNTSRNGNVVAVRCVRSSDGLMFVSEGGMIVRIGASTIRQIGRNTQGVRVVNLKPEDRLIAAARLAEDEDAASSENMLEESGAEST